MALYGIGNIRDERFHYEMKAGRIALWKPKEEAEDWFNLLLIHQNRSVFPLHLSHNSDDFDSVSRVDREWRIIQPRRRSVMMRTSSSGDTSTIVSPKQERFPSAVNDITSLNLDQVSLPLSQKENRFPSAFFVIHYPRNGQREVHRHVSLVTIQGAEEFEMRSIRLRTVRPFIFDEIVLADEQKADSKLDLRTKSQINQFLKKKVRCPVLLLCG